MKTKVTDPTQDHAEAMQPLLALCHAAPPCHTLNVGNRAGDRRLFPSVNSYHSVPSALTLWQPPLSFLPSLSPCAAAFLPSLPGSWTTFSSLPYLEPSLRGLDFLILIRVTWASLGPSIPSSRLPTSPTKGVKRGREYLMIGSFSVPPHIGILV